MLFRDLKRLNNSARHVTAKQKRPEQYSGRVFFFRNQLPGYSFRKAD